MINTKELARKILSGLSNPVVNNEVWLRDVLDDAYDSLLRENYKLKGDVLSLENEVSDLRLELRAGVRE
jgi:hypothetical protein